MTGFGDPEFLFPAGILLRNEGMFRIRHRLNNFIADAFARSIWIRQNNNATVLRGCFNEINRFFINRTAMGFNRIDIK